MLAIGDMVLNEDINNWAEYFYYVQHEFQNTLELNQCNTHDKFDFFIVMHGNEYGDDNEYENYSTFITVMPRIQLIVQILLWN